MIDLHFSRTPNCWKVAIMLHELEQPFNVISYNLLKGDHLTPEYASINPNHKVPAIVDHAPADGGQPITLAESGAILIYLAEKHGAFLPTEPRRRALVLQWLAWQISAFGPIAGQLSHFVRYSPVRHEYSIKRFENEFSRLVHVLERGLGENEYIANEFSIADIAIWPMTSTIDRTEMAVKLADFPNVSRWLEVVSARPSVAKLFEDPRTAIDPALLQTSRTLTEDEWSNIYGEQMLAAARAKPGR